MQERPSRCKIARYRGTFRNFLLLEVRGGRFEMTGVKGAARWRLTAVVVLVPLAVVAALLIWQDYHARREATVVKLELRSARINAQLEDFVRTTEGVAGLFAASFGLRHPDLNADLGASLSGTVPADPLLEELLAKHPNYTYAAIANPDGKILAASAEFPAGTRVEESGFFERVVATNGFTVSDFVATANGSPPSAMFAYQVRDLNGNLGGYLLLKSELAVISSVFDASTGLPGRAKSGIFDSRGRVLAGTGYEQPVFGGAAGDDISGTELWERAQQQPADVWIGEGLDKVASIIFFGDLEKTPWVTTVAFPQSEFFAPLWRRAWGFSAGLAGTVIGMVILAELARRREHLAWAAVKSERETLQSVVDGATDGILVLAGGRGASYVNQRFCEMFGVQAEPTLGASGEELARAFGRSALLGDEAASKLKSLLAIGESCAVETIKLSTPGAREVRVIASPICTASGVVSGRTLVVHDVTDERRVQRMKSEFAVHASHQLRTPVASILASSELLLRPEPSPSKREKWAKLVYSQALRMRNTINTLLNLSQLESGRINLNLTNVDISSIASEVVRNLGVQTGRHDFSVSIPSDLRAVLGDRGRLVEVLNNLVENAVKYSPRGGTVSISAQAFGGGQVVIQVKDHGVGIGKDDLDSLFSPYQRAAAREHGFATGTGLGLYIVKFLVEAQGGKVWAKSEPGVGSTFSFTVPRATATVGVTTPRHGIVGPAGVPAVNVVPGTVRMATDPADPA